MLGLRHVPRALNDTTSMWEGDGIKEEERMITTEEAMENIIIQLDHVIKTAQSENDIAPEAGKHNKRNRNSTWLSI